MSTKFKSLERVDRAAAYELQNEINKITTEAANAANRAREQAIQDAQIKISQIKQETLQREQAIINNLRSETNNKLAQQDANHRSALLDMSGAFQSQLNQKSSEFNEKLKDVRKQNQNDIKKIRNETNNLINNLTREVNNAFEVQNEVNRKHQSQINNIKNEVKNLQQNITDQISWARENLKNCNKNISEMENDIAIKRFQAQELERVKRSVASAESLIQSAPQAAIGNLTEARINLMDIRQKAQISQAIFDSLYEQSLSGIKTLLDTVQHNKTNTNVQGTNIELDFWTNGKYAEFENKVSKLNAEINNALKNPEVNIDRLTDIIKDINLLEFEEEALVVEAVKNIELSQNRNEMADVVINKLLDANFIIKKNDDEGYIADDYREGYYATLVDRGNQDISMTVLVESVFSESDNSIINRVNIQRNDTTDIDLRMIEEYRDLIESAMGTDGCDVKRLNVPDQKIFDANAIKNTKLTEQQKARLR